MAESIRLLVADDDPDVLDSMALVLAEEGYAVTTAKSLTEALECVERETFAFVLTDLFDHSAQGLLQLGALRDAAHPTAVGVTTAWRMPPETVLQAGFACFVSKPFDLDDLLSTVAAAVHLPLQPEQRSQAHALRMFLKCLGAGDWDGAVRQCSDDVVYVGPYGVPLQGVPVVGRDAYRAYIEATAQTYPGFTIRDVHIVSTPHGMAARYTSSWRQRGLITMTAGVVAEFDTESRIRQIGVRVNMERLHVLQTAN